jgi:hypothetical protein
MLAQHIHGNPDGAEQAHLQHGLEQLPECLGKRMAAALGARGDSFRNL